MSSFSGRFPEHQKERANREKREVISSFLDWLEDEKGYTIEIRSHSNMPTADLEPIYLLSDFLSVDESKMAAEKAIMDAEDKQRDLLEERTQAMRDKGWNVEHLGGDWWYACDGKCNKAWGISDRDSIQLDVHDEDDFAWLADDELGESGNELIPGDEFPHKWCRRECERFTELEGEENELRDFSKRVYNKPSSEQKG